MRKILACIDGSEISAPVIRQAFALAEANRAEGIEVLHVVDSEVESLVLSGGIEGAAGPVGGIGEEVRNKVERFVDGVVNLSEVKVPYVVNVIVGSAYKVIVKRAGENGFDLVVMGHRGLKGLNRFLLGSVAAKVVPYAPCHVLVLRSESAETPKKVLVAVDGGEQSARVMAFGLDHALRVGAEEILFLNVIEDLTEISHAYWGNFTADPEFYEKASRNACEDMSRILGEITPFRDMRKLKVKTEIAKGRIHATIIRVAESEGADLVVVGDRGKSGIDGFLLGSVSAKIVRYAHCAVLVCRTGYRRK